MTTTPVEADFHRGGRERISHAITRQHWFAGLGWSGFAIVAIVALIDAIRQSIKIIVTQPFEQWIVWFLRSYVYA